VIHRDVKPANVMIEPGDRVLVTDFGIAKAMREGTLTESGAIMGTPYYMSPEQAMGGELTGRTDQYSVAVMAFQMLAGQVPFDADTAVAILHKHIVEEPPPLDSLRPGLPKHVGAAVRRGLAKKPEERFDTVTGLVEAMAGRRSVGKVPARRGRGWWPVSALVGGVAVVAGAAGVLVLAPRDNRVVEAPPDTTPEQGWLLLDNIPAGATMLVDGRAVAGSPVPLATGRHELRILAEGYQTLDDSVLVLASESTAWRFTGQPSGPRGQSPRETPTTAAAPPVAAPPTSPPATVELPAGSGILVLQISGGWARIFLDDRARGTDSRLRDTLPAGTHTLRLERPGYVTVDTALAVEAGVTTNVRITMRPQGEQ
jgi:serine/threonine-protein kinase